MNTALKKYGKAVGNGAIANMYGEHARAVGRFTGQAGVKVNGSSMHSSIMMMRLSPVVASNEIIESNFYELFLDEDETERLVIPDYTTLFFRMQILTTNVNDNKGVAASHIGGIIANNGTVIMYPGDGSAIDSCTRIYTQALLAGWKMEASYGDWGPFFVGECSIRRECLYFWVQADDVLKAMRVWVKPLGGYGGAGSKYLITAHLDCIWHNIGVPAAGSS